MAIYFDNGATSYPKPENVYEAMDTYMRQNGASSGRGNYRRAMAASELLYGARKSVAYSNMDKIEPTIEQKKVVSIMDFYKLLPKTNCKKMWCSYLHGFCKPAIPGRSQT